MMNSHEGFAVSTPLEGFRDFYLQSAAAFQLAVMPIPKFYTNKIPQLGKVTLPEALAKEASEVWELHDHLYTWNEKLSKHPVNTICTFAALCDFSYLAEKHNAAANDFFGWVYVTGLLDYVKKNEAVARNEKGGVAHREGRLFVHGVCTWPLFWLLNDCDGALEDLQRRRLIGLERGDGGAKPIPSRGRFSTDRDTKDLAEAWGIDVPAVRWRLKELVRRGQIIKPEGHWRFDEETYDEIRQMVERIHKK